MNQNREKLEQETVAKTKELLAKKERLFASKELGRWDLDLERSRSVPREDLLKDKNLAFSMMLFQVLILSISRLIYRKLLRQEIKGIWHFILILRYIMNS